MLKLYKPKIYNLWFRQKLLADDSTMSFNINYGGTINFPIHKWFAWYNKWIRNNDSHYYYRYLVNENNKYIGEVAYHFDTNEKIYLLSIIIYAPYRHLGYGKKALSLLCEAAKENGISEVYDNIDIQNNSLTMFLNYGFKQIYRTNEYIILKKTLFS